VTIAAIVGDDDFRERGGNRGRVIRSELGRAFIADPTANKTATCRSTKASYRRPATRFGLII
jgi:hypothetical protein